VRPIRRADRDQLTALVNAHAQAVVPGVVMSVNSVLSQLEAEPGEFIVDPWVDRRATLVAEQRGRVVAMAHLLHYRADGDVGESYRDVGEIRWLLCWPPAPFWPATDAAGDALAAAAVAWLQDSGARRLYADGALPAPGVYGLPEQWPHVHAVLRRAGFTPGEHADLVLLADVSALPRPPSPLAGLSVARTLGVNGTRFTAPLDEQPVGDLEVQQRGDAGRLVTQQGFADAGNLHVKPATDAAASALGCWARLPTGCTSATPIGCWMDYCSPDDEGYRAFLQHAGFHPLTHTTRGWERLTTTAL
jgi:hypothetical protein